MQGVFGSSRGFWHVWALERSEHEMEHPLYFEGRRLRPHAEFIRDAALVVGETYFTVRFVDQALRVPEMTALVFIGPDRAPGDAGQLYFQDAASYYAGVRFERTADNDDAEFHVVARGTPFVCQFEQALDMLLRCSLDRRRERE